MTNQPSDTAALTARELLACPFCGAVGRPKIQMGLHWEISCGNELCPVVVIAASDSFENALHFWNTRTPLPAPEPRDQVREALQWIANQKGQHGVTTDDLALVAENAIALGRCQRLGRCGFPDTGCICGVDPSASLPQQQEAEPEGWQDDELGLFDLGREFLEEYERHHREGAFPNFTCAQSPVEILVHLINERDEALADHPAPQPEPAGRREEIARTLYECEKRRATNADAVVKGAFPNASNALLMEPWDECKDVFLSDADAILPLLQASTVGREASQLSSTTLGCDDGAASEVTSHERARK